MAQNWSYISLCLVMQCKLVLQTPFFSLLHYHLYVLQLVFILSKCMLACGQITNFQGRLMTTLHMLHDSPGYEGAYDIVSQNPGKILDNQNKPVGTNKCVVFQNTKRYQNLPPPPSMYMIPLSRSCSLPPLPCPEMFFKLCSPNKQTEIIAHFQDI